MFPGGKGEALYFLSLLDNADKQVTLTPILGVAKASLSVFWPVGNYQAWSITVLGIARELVSIGDIPEGGHVELQSDVLDPGRPIREAVIWLDDNCTRVNFRASTLS